MRWLRANWLSFRRIHLSALIADWRRTLLSVIGVALGVTVVLGVWILKVDIFRPFDSFGPALTHATDVGTVEVTPNVSARLPIEMVDRLGAEVPGAQAVVPVVAGLTPVAPVRGNGSHLPHGFFLLGGSCQIELLVGSFDCERRAREVRQPAPGAGMPLQIPTAIAERYGLRPGDELRIPGLPPGSAHFGSTFPDIDSVKGINDGYVLMAPSAEAAAILLGVPGYVTAAFVLPRPGADVRADIDRIVAGVATAGPPRPQQPALLANASQSFNVNLMGGIIVGLLIAMNTILLAIEERRAVMGTIAAIGARPFGLLSGMLGEGAVIGVLGGVLGVPSGFMLGRHLVASFGQAMLAGSGATLSAHFSPALIAVGAGAGIMCGVVAMVGPAVKLVREGPLASMASAGGVQHARRIPTWSLLAGAATMAGAYALCKMVARGSLPMAMGVNAMTLWMFGVGLVAIWSAPRVAELSAGLVTVVRSDIGRLLSADVRRYTLLFAFSTGVLAVGANLAIAAHSMQLLGASQIAAEKADSLPNSLLIASQSVLDQRDSQLASATVELVRRAAVGREISSRWRSTISSGSSSRLVIGVTPGDWYSLALYQPVDMPETFWHGLGDGEIGLSEVAAGRLGAKEGQTVELSTIHGPKRYRVAGIFRPKMVNDAAVGDLVLVAESLSRSDWAAVCDQVAVAFSSAGEASAHRNDFLRINAGLVVYDNEEWRSAASQGITRFLRPLKNSGYLVMTAAGLSVLNVFVLGLVQRKRERAALRAIGVLVRQEQAVVIAHGALLAVLAAVFGGLGGVGLAYLWALESPVQYGIKIDWDLLGSPLRTGSAAVFAIIAAAVVYPVIKTRRLESAEVLRTA